MKARFILAFPVGLLALVAVAGCGGSSNDGSATAATGGPGAGASPGKAGAAMVDVAKVPELGGILVDAQGRTLYLFQKDANGRSACAGKCAQIWPPDVSSGSPKAGHGVNAAMLGAVKRSDGSTQVTYAGHPLYTYTADTAPGDTTGNGINTFGGVWNAVEASGAKAPAGSTSSGGSTGGGGGGGSSSGGSYGY